jgi:LacI family transcriptional regulator
MASTSSITIHDLARKAKVSASLVSVALHGSKSSARVGQKTKARILALAEKLNYVGDASARRIRRNKRIGFVSSTWTNLYENDIRREVYEAINSFEKDVPFVTIPFTEGKSWFATLMAEGFSHLVLNYGWTRLSTPEQEKLKSHFRERLFLLGSDLDDKAEDLSFASISTFGMLREIFDYARETGSQYPGALVPGKAFRHSRSDFFRRLATTSAKWFSYQAQTFDFDENDQQTIRTAARKAAEAGCDFLFVHNDASAIAAYTGISDAGKKIPKDIRVMGFDDLEFSPHLIPSLSTVRIDRSVFGSSVKSWIASGFKKQQSSVSYQIILRKST